MEAELIQETPTPLRPKRYGSLPTGSSGSSFGRSTEGGLGKFANRECVQMQQAMESCVGKSVLSGVMGFGMGGVFGLFMASVRAPFRPSLMLVFYSRGEK